MAANNARVGDLPGAGEDSRPSWFGPGLGDSEAGALDEALPRSSTVGEDAQFFVQQPRRLVNAGGSAFLRLYRAFLGARMALGLALVATLLLATAIGATAPRWALLVCSFYAFEATALWLLPRVQRSASAQTLSRLNSPQWLASIGFDLLLFGLLHATDHQASVNYGALFVMPVLMAGVLTPRLLTLATAAIAALLMLGTAGWNYVFGLEPDLRLTQAGMTGIGLFVIGLLASELASRLAREERAARGSLELARQQAQLSRLVIDEMQEGVLVVDRRGRVRAANPSARALLGERQPARTAPFQLRGVGAWDGLVRSVEQAFLEGSWPEEGRDIVLRFGPESQRGLRLRMRFTRSRESQAGEDLCVLFIEDHRTVLARSRQEKLAAMGRVSAGIAHEIRNPLAAIAQANALMAEDADDAQQRKLTSMVAANVDRLKRIVDDVMELAPGRPPQAVPLDLARLLPDICADWARTNGLGHEVGGLLRLELPSSSCWAQFEPEHLRRVVINLLDNGLRHAPRQAAALRVSLRSGNDGAVVLSVFNLGAPIAPEVERHLFEPFFSTRSRGSGLGLYICRELCERYGARIDYRRHDGDAKSAGNEFLLSLNRSISASTAVTA
ncbi:ATP-binding protein [Pelomonas sp. SE-A7]|uniref:sensor histidine kinase n=1 Tax=Pelomonas sp. SE-A7 TaxID=3054953 RepID=UPI00259C833C|nr:ATP-binding protein [Pelomonas sp. SE-A7]MDM4767655.1 ATP-binding protein [Pelomonas sp. SE-A7]